MLKDEIKKKKTSIIQKEKLFLAIIRHKKARAHSGQHAKPTYSIMRSSNPIERKMKKIMKPNFFKNHC
jgi:hypothetical protein